ncbi:hypothetical protein J6590_042115 [Homalodisca vitripennis]|nr:hypothetical protein J6590_042115 [Homalodisca vitripennis]
MAAVTRIWRKGEKVVVYGLVSTEKKLEAVMKGIWFSILQHEYGRSYERVAAYGLVSSSTLIVGVMEGSYGRVAEYGLVSSSTNMAGVMKGWQHTAEYPAARLWQKLRKGGRIRFSIQQHDYCMSYEMVTAYGLVSKQQLLSKHCLGPETRDNRKSQRQPATSEGLCHGPSSYNGTRFLIDFRFRFRARDFKLSSQQHSS